MLKIGSERDPVLLILPALFEEGNRMRRFTVELMRTLAVHGFACWLPDLRGMGESPVALADVSFDDWRADMTAIASTIRQRSQPLRTLAIRGGALLDEGADAGWRMEPCSGAKLLRDMLRATALSTGQPMADIERTARRTGAELAGNLLSPALFDGLMGAEPAIGNYRSVRVSQQGDAPDTLAGSRLWSRAEPGDDPALVEAAARDILTWARA